MAEVQASRFGPISLWSAVVSFGQLWSALQVGFSAADTNKDNPHPFVSV